MKRKVYFECIRCEKWIEYVKLIVKEVSYDLIVRLFCKIKSIY